MLSALAFAGSRRAKWFVAGLWLVIVFGVAGGGLIEKYTDAEKNETSSFLPGDAESVKALEATERFPSGEVVAAVIVYQRPGGLTAADRERVAANRANLNAKRPVATSAFQPPVFSRDGTTALLVGNVKPEGEGQVLLDAADDIRGRVTSGGGGLDIKLTGPAGYAADAVKVFESINGTLVLATGLLVFLLLILIYRSPIFWLIPFFSVIVAELSSRGLGYGLTELGITVNGQSSSILTVLVFGAGTDYALLLVARYREELRRHEDRHEALGLALRAAGPAIVASGLTVIAALLCLSLAEVNGTSGLGPIGAMGIALAMIVMLTLLPALLAIAGRRAFWPFIPRFGDEGADETHGFWRRLGERVSRRPRPVWIGSLAVLALLSLGLFSFNTNLTTANSYREDVDAVKGQELIARAFPAGATAPTNVVVGDVSRVDAVRAALQGSPAVASLGPVERGAPGARFDATLKAEAYSTKAFDQIPALRKVAKQAGGPSTLIGGPSAEERDLRVSSARDSKLIIPLTLVVVFVILAILLRAVLAPVLLIATVIVSFTAALGVSSFVFDKVFGFPGSDASLPLFAFVFLVALGIDYNIFLMARVREESLRRGTRQGMLRGLAVTGGVITSAGIVLAGTFSVLATLPLVFLTEIGFVIAFGILLDTFLVRSVLVPALAFDLGPRIWWPSTLSKSIDRRETFRPEADRLEADRGQRVGPAPADA